MDLNQFNEKQKAVLKQVSLPVVFLHLTNILAFCESVCVIFSHTRGQVRREKRTLSKMVGGLLFKNSQRGLCATAACLTGWVEFLHQNSDRIGVEMSSVHFLLYQKFLPAYPQEIGMFNFLKLSSSNFTLSYFPPTIAIIRKIRKAS
jgi:hypothetical protein